MKVLDSFQTVLFPVAAAISSENFADFAELPCSGL
jgi:hypothetical protein